jgi:hypothetical protein
VERGLMRLLLPSWGSLSGLSDVEQIEVNNRCKEWNGKIRVFWKIGLQSIKKHTGEIMEDRDNTSHSNWKFLPELLL